jgi:hypothetical protein
MDKYITGELSSKERRRIFSKISFEPNGGCWNWTGSLDQQGYGLLWFHGRTERIHRVIYAIFKGPVERCSKKREQLDHLCRNHRCCNPLHLEMVSHKTNVLRGTGITAVNSRKTHCPKGHPYPEYNGTARKYCKICDSIRHKERINGPNRKYWLEKANDAQKRWYNKHRGN